MPTQTTSKTIEIKLCQLFYEGGVYLLREQKRNISGFPDLQQLIEDSGVTVSGSTVEYQLIPHPHFTPNVCHILKIPYEYMEYLQEDHHELLEFNIGYLLGNNTNMATLEVLIDPYMSALDKAVARRIDLV